MTELPVVPTETFLSTSVQLLLPLAGQIDAELVGATEGFWPVIVASTKSPFTAFKGTPTVTERYPGNRSLTVLSFVQRCCWPDADRREACGVPEGVPSAHGDAAGVVGAWSFPRRSRR